MFENLVLWQKLVLYAMVLIGIFIFVKTSQFKILGVPLIKLRYRIILALFFPMIFVILFIFGALLFALVLVVLLVLLLYSVFGKRKIRIRIG